MIFPDNNDHNNSFDSENLQINTNIGELAGSNSKQKDKKTSKSLNNSYLDIPSHEKSDAQSEAPAT